MKQILRTLLLSAAVSFVAIHSARAALIPAEPEYVKSLNGTWRFKLEQLGAYDADSEDGKKLMPVRLPETFEPFQTPEYVEGKEWVDLKVPGNWEMAGLSPATYNEPDNASGFYRLWFEVPKSWEGRQIRLAFDGVQNGAELWVNGKPIMVNEPSWGRTNYHESGWTAFQANPTPVVKFGEKNLLAIRVAKNTRSTAMDSGDYFFLGGIHRPVTLFAVPRMHLSDLTVQTKLLADGKAEVKVLADLTGKGPATMVTRLEGVPGEGTAKFAKGKAVLTQVVEQPKLWSAEFPNLYTLTVELKNGKGKTIETVTKRIGIREISIKDAVLLVNGAPVKLAGMCRHDVSATEGTAVGPDLWRRDITFMKSANVNAIRTSHYPYGEGFYDLCDELGMYVMDELPYCWCPTDKPEDRPAFEQRARETVRRDKNHPCVLLWAVGNENKQGRNLQVVADLVKELDPTRPRAVSWYDGDKYKVELSDSHYTVPSAMAKAGKAARKQGMPHIYLENPNTGDARLGPDASFYERWGAVIQRTWDVCLEYDTIPGTFIFEWQDRAVADKNPTKYYRYFPETGINLLKMKGIVDAFRNPRPSLYELQMAYSPIRIGGKATAADGKVSFPVENWYSFTDLSHLKAVWALEQTGKAIASGDSRVKVAPLAKGNAEITVPADALAQADAFRVEFIHPDGRSIVAHRFTLKDIPVKSEINSALPPGLPIPQFNLVTRVTQKSAKYWREVFRFPAHLTNVVVEPASAKTLAELKQLTADVVGGSNNSVVGKIRAEYANNAFSYQLDWTGGEADVQELGWAFQLPPDCDHFSWNRVGRWTVYPETCINRLAGTATPDSMKVALTKMDLPNSFDFNSTKYDCNWASLTSVSGAGLRTEFDPAQRFQCRAGVGESSGYVLFVNQQVSPADDYVRPVVGEYFMALKPGDAIKGRFRVGSNRASAGQ